MSEYKKMAERLREVAQVTSLYREPVCDVAATAILTLETALAEARQGLAATQAKLESAQKDDYGFLLEQANTHPALYLRLEEKSIVWTHDAYKALRFSRNEDALACWNYVRRLHDIKDFPGIAPLIVEHAFARAAPARTESAGDAREGGV